jgi:hypothetical protein
MKLVRRTLGARKKNLKWKMEDRTRERKLKGEEEEK